MDPLKLICLLFIPLLMTVYVTKAQDEDEVSDEAASADEENGDEDGIKEEDDVLVLTKDNFDEIVYSRENVLVEFYAPWCGHCKKLEPEYAKAAKILKTSEPPVYLAKVDATVESDLASKFDVSGYPTIKFFKKGEAFEYDDARTAEGIIRYMKVRSSPDWKPPPDAVVSLTKDDFQEFVDSNELSLVEFYAPWCGHCKQLAPAYEKAAKQLQTLENPIPLAKVDATVENDLAKQFDVTGYPTLKMFRKGRPFEYNGPRDENGIANYMIMQQGEASKLKLDTKEVKEFMHHVDVVIVGFFESIEDPLLRAYMDAANELREDFKFAHTVSKDARNHYKVNPKSVVVFTPERFYTKYEPKWHILDVGTKSSEVVDIKKFVTDHSVPLVGEYTTDNQKRRYESKRPLCLVFFDVDWSFDHRDATQLWRNKVAKIANDYKDITFAVADEQEFSFTVNEFGLGDSGEEINIGCYGADSKKYKMEPMEEWEDDEVEEFLNKLKKGKIEPQVKSQPIPKRQDGPVKVVVGKNFDKIVKDKKKDVLIEMYAPWCGHCKHLEPVYKDLAKKLKGEKNLVIAKMDATANDVPDTYRVEGFPTIYFAPSDNKDKPLKFDGDRTVEGFEKYLKDHATASFKSAKEEL